MGHHGNSFLSFGGEPGAVGGWVELARTTLGSANANITVSSLSDKRYYMVLVNIDGRDAVNTGGQYRTGNSTIATTDYARRVSTDGGTDVTTVSTNHWADFQAFSTTPDFGVSNIANLSANEKLMQGWQNFGITGAGTAPKRTEDVGKWVNTSNPLDLIDLYTGGSDTWNTNSEVVVLGWDPTDTHTNNFWEELASVEITSASDTIDSGTITAKKYLWVQYYVETTSTGQPFMTFNSDSASNYSERISLNGASDSTQVSQTNFEIGNAAVADNPQFGNMFIINNSANEKLVIQRTVGQQGTAASIAPRRVEMVSKWANTAAQITDITLGVSSGSYVGGSFLKVWGSN